MNVHYRAIREAARRIGDAVDRSVDALKQGRVEQEPAMTDRMLGAIEESLVGMTSEPSRLPDGKIGSLINDYVLRPSQAVEIKWTAKTLTDRGKGSQESKIGADFMGVLQIDLPDYQVSKGFLAQAKLLRNGKITGITETKRQCEQMLKHSPESYLFIYSPKEVRVVSALAVISSDRSPTELYSKTARRFYTDHLECFVGDRSITAPTPAMIEELRDRYDARAIQLIRARWAWESDDEDE